ncbi:hypothetical protein FGB62_15g28 [Gracilaria domingensis]|nr:hypothetical protein FGB62_15g28 [Gracilaria domingensis]
MSHIYTPSAESLAVFDQLKAEVDHKRSAALASLKATRTVCKETGQETGTGDGKCISSTSARSWFGLLSPGRPTALPREETVCSRKEKGTVEETMAVNEFDHRDGQTFASLDPLSLSSSIKSWRVLSSSTSRQSSAVVEEMQLREKGSSASASSCTIGGVNETGAAHDCSSTSVSPLGGCFKALPGCAKKQAIAEKAQVHTKVSTRATGMEAVGEVKVVSWEWFEAHSSQERTSGSLRIEAEAPPQYTPSAESLAVFDEVKAEVDRWRSSALASLKAIRRGNEGCSGDGAHVSATNAARSWWDSSSFPVATGGRRMKQANTGRGCRDESLPLADVERRALCKDDHVSNGKEAGEHARTSGLTRRHNDVEVIASVEEARKKRATSSCARGNDGTERDDGAVSIPATAADAKESPSSGGGTANNESVLERDGALRAGESNRREGRQREQERSKGRGKKVAFGPMTEKQAAAAEWREAVRQHQSRLRGEKPSSWRLWKRAHIPFQLRSSRASAASGASCGWELNERLARRVRTARCAAGGGACASARGRWRTRWRAQRARCCVGFAPSLRTFTRAHDVTSHV